MSPNPTTFEAYGERINSTTGSAVADKSRTKKLKQTNASVHVVRSKSKIREGSPEGIRKTTEERISETVEFYVWSERPME